MKLLGLELAPLRVPLNRRLQTLAVLQHILSMMCAPLIFITATVLLLFSPLCGLVLFYFVWFYLDRHTPRRGSRPTPWTRRSMVWRYFRDYFPVSMVKTAELDQRKNYVMACHPHGIFSLSAIASFGTEANDFSNVFPGLAPYLCTLKINFYVPLWREYVMSFGAVEVSKESINYLLDSKKRGNAVVIVIGGASEALGAQPGSYDVILKSRRGFVKLALENGASLVPVIFFGENDLYNQINGNGRSLLRKFQHKLKSIFKYSLPIFHGRGVFNYTFGVMPYRKPLITVVGAPIDVEKCENPTEEQVDRLHGLYTESLVNLFEQYKTKCNVPEETKMNIM